MKRISIFIALAMIFVSCGAPSNRVCVELEERQNWDGAKLYGDIATIAETSYELAGSYGRTVKTELISQKLVEFNERGDLLLSVEYDIDSTLIEKLEYRYDTKGYLAEYVNHGDGYKFSNRYLRDDYGAIVERDLLKADGSIEMRYTSVYDSSGNVVENVDYDSDGMVVNHVVTKYDKANRPVEVKRFARSGEILRRDVYSYDAQGRVAETLVYDTFDALEGHQVYTYGENGLDKECVTYNANSAVDSRVVERYDERGNLVELINYDGGVVVESIQNIFDEANNIVEERRTTTNGVVLSLKNYKYNEAGLLIEYIDDDKFHGQYNVTSYRYDDKNNLIEEMSYAGARRVPQYVVEYVITYR